MGGDIAGYRKILKGTAIFGSVQVFNIIINLVRGKLVALFLGPEGMGISSLYFSSSNTIQQIASLGLNLSIVREISQIVELHEGNRLSFVLVVVRKLLYCSAILGALLTIVFAHQLSLWTFGNSQYTWQYVILSIVVFLTTLSNGELSILQGQKYIKKIAFATIISSVVGLFVGVPLYYYLGYDGIIPAMLVLSLSIYIFYKYNTARISSSKVTVGWQESVPLAKRMISLGVIMMLSNLLGTLATYILNSFISNFGSIRDVGLFQAASSITNQYVGLVFTAMSLEFFPRLSAICANNEEVRTLVNRQSEIVIFIIAPLVLLLIVTSPIVIRVLLTPDFLSLIPVIRWLSLGIFFKAIAFPMSYISFSKGDRKTFFWLEGAANIYVLLINIFFYNYWGVVGLGVSYCLLSIIQCIIYVIVTKRLYGFYHNFDFIKVVSVISVLIVVTFFLSFLKDEILSYSSMFLLFIICLVYCFKELEKRVGIWENIKKSLSRRFHQ